MSARQAAASDALIQDIREQSHELRTARDLDQLVEDVSQARVVMLGEASHGTSEYYMWRSLISQRLITEKGFTAIAVEGDWPDCYRVNRYIKGYDHTPASAYDVLKEFHRWPTWMWANREVERLAEWLRARNAASDTGSKVGFYGLDVYSLWDSINEVVDYLDRVDPEAAAVAREAYRCFEPYGYNEEAYALSASPLHSCEDDAIRVLEKLLHSHEKYKSDPEAAFNAEQNALIAKDAEHYYRTMLRGDTASWNIRDRHMMDTLKRLLAYLGPDAKIIVWAHNTHVGDARYTDMKNTGAFNIGQLAREELGKAQVLLVGFSTFHGKVIAGHAWDAPMEVMRVPPARESSWDEILHAACRADCYLRSRDVQATTVGGLEAGQRAIGVVYHPAGEFGNYVPTELFERYDYILNIDRTTALHPIHTTDVNLTLLPETYPVNV